MLNFDDELLRMCKIWLDRVDDLVAQELLDESDRPAAVAELVDTIISAARWKGTLMNPTQVMITALTRMDFIDSDYDG